MVKGNKGKEEKCYNILVEGDGREIKGIKERELITTLNKRHKNFIL